jgi:hypothetical protein
MPLASGGDAGTSHTKTGAGDANDVPAFFQHVSELGVDVR